MALRIPTTTSWLASLLLLIQAGLTGKAEAGAETEGDLFCPEFVTRHAPLVWLHSEDPFQPSDILTHIQRTTPHLNHAPLTIDLPDLNLDNLELLNNVSNRVQGEDLDAFFFYFYSYDQGPNITQVLEPLDQLVRGPKAESGMSFGNHVGDWEHNMVRFKGGKPTGIYYSQHEGGTAYDWDATELTLEDERPIVYSARGSHANFAYPGNRIHNKVLIDYCDAGRRWDPILSAYFYHYSPSTHRFTTLSSPLSPAYPSPPPYNYTSWLYFSGRWGDTQYPDSDPRQETIPRFHLSRFVTGPSGPLFKQLVRKGLLPDRRHKESWKEWAVGIFMMFYPCCIKGWRKWVSLGALIAVFAGIVIGVVVLVRKLRRKLLQGKQGGGDYRRIEASEVLLDDWSRNEESLSSSSDDDDDHEHIGR
ncbi:hypothetical protein NLU13_0155 [Sarocladium strictum]|uniref:Vacuolar protein sorting-associated protein 62 n=1 Tax=Sarocladium strictum TaxID=5046 RepID=A0AA39GNU7_SARSR|nr:hypothetical protein NLU13_0155 [Sarocladium strictum]